MIDFQRRWGKRSEDFQILAFHDDSLETLKELDEKTSEIQNAYWGGEPLPFPVLMDAGGQTLEAFGVNKFPTSVLIDPKGHVVQWGTHVQLEEWLLSTSPEVKEMLEGLAREFSKYLAMAIQRGDVEAAYALVQFAKEAADPGHFLELAKGLEQVGGSQAIAFFVSDQGVSSASRGNRLVAVRALGKIAGPRHYRVIDALETLVNDDVDPEVRKAAQQVLADLRSR